MEHRDITILGLDFDHAKGVTLQKKLTINDKHVMVIFLKSEVKIRSATYIASSDLLKITKDR